MPSRKLSKPEQIALRFDANEGLVAGVDEAGRGPLAGPVVAAAVILDDMQRIKGLNDSKQLTALQRERLFDEIRAHALAFCVAEASVAEIDELNILHATMLAMKRAVEGLRLPPHKVLVDGNRLPKIRIRAEAVIGGDAHGGVDLGGVHPGQGHARPHLRRARAALPAVRLRRAQGLRHRGAPGRARRARALRLASAVVRAGAHRGAAARLRVEQE